MLLFRLHSSRVSAPLAVRPDPARVFPVQAVACSSNGQIFSSSFVQLDKIDPVKIPIHSRDYPVGIPAESRDYPVLIPSPERDLTGSLRVSPLDNGIDLKRLFTRISRD